MDQKLKSKCSRTFSAATIVAVLSAILVISPRLASAETIVPPALAQKMLLPEPDNAQMGEGAFDTPFFDAKKAPITLADFRGTGVVLNLWATWCAPCVREMPALNRLSAKLKGRGVEVVAISEDRKALDKVAPFYAENAITHLDVYYDLKSQLSRKLGVVGLPTTVLIAADGRVVGTVKGVVEWDDDAIVEYLAKTLAP